ncbi:MAG: DUF2384 domain-containing protein [Nitrospiraceae bacterium]|nr:DUF2384 domain-containing protein [Nitrospiraceae bacterium]
MYDVRNVFGIKRAKIDFHEEILNGFPFSWARSVQRHLDMSDKDLANFMCISISTFRRIKREKRKFSRKASDRLYRLAALFAWAVDVLHSKEDARKWLTSPHPLLNGRIPIELAETDPGKILVENILQQDKAWHSFVKIRCFKRKI